MFRFFDERTLASALLACAVLLGMALPSSASILKPYALPALFLVVVLSLIPFAKLPIDNLFSMRAPVLRVVAWQQFALPCIVISVAIVAKLPDTIIVFTVVTACSGALFASPALAELLHLNRQRALQCMVLSTLLTPISLFLFLSLFRDASTALNIAMYIERIAVFLIAPFVLFAAYRIVATRCVPDALDEKLNFISRWGVIVALIVFCIGIMSDVSDEFGRAPQVVLFDLAIATLVCSGMLLLTVIVMYRFGQDEALTAGIVVGFRNVGLGYALVGDAIGHQLAVYVGISMLPMFVTPVIIRVVYANRSASARSSSSAVEPNIPAVVA